MSLRQQMRESKAFNRIANAQFFYSISFEGDDLGFKEQNFCQIKKGLRPSFSQRPIHNQFYTLDGDFSTQIGMGNGQFFIQFEGGDMGIKERNFCQIKK